MQGEITANGLIIGGMIGQRGAPGNGIVGIEKTGESGLVDTYTITYTDGTTDTIQVTNGAKGDKGDKGDQGIQGIQGVKGDKGDKGDTGEQGMQGIQGERGEKGEQGERGERGYQGIAGEKGDKGDKGDTGNTGATGATGNGISSISKTGTSGLVDTYTITYTDGTTTTFDVTNGADGNVTDVQVEGTSVVDNGVANINGLATQEELDYYKTIYNVLPKVEGNGESITLNNTGESILKLDIRGQCKQDSTTGKNLLNPSVATSNCSVSGGLITITSNTTDVYIQGAYVYSEANKFLTLEAGNYYIKSTNSNVRITIYTDGNSLDTDGTQPNVLSSTTKCGGIRIRSNSSLQNVTFGIMLATTNDSFEPYTGGIASPNPDYPQPIHEVSGDNEINVEGKNMASDKWEDYTYTGNYAICPITLEQGATYKLSATRIGELKPNYYNYGIVKDGTSYNSFVSLMTCVDYGTGEANSTITINVDSTWVSPKLVCYVQGNPQSKFEELMTNFHIQFEKATAKTDYEPYDKDTYELDLGVENIFDKDNVVDDSYYDTDGTITSSNSYFRVDDYTYCYNKKNLTISGCIDTGGNIIFYSENKSFVDYFGFRDRTIEIPNNAYYYRISSRKTNKDTLQLEFSSKANSYSPFGQAPIKMRGIGTYEDYFVRNSDGQWCKYNAIGKKIFDGTETYTKVRDYVFSTTFAEAVYPADTSYLMNCLCDKYTRKSNQENWDNYDYLISYYSATTKIAFRNKDTKEITDFQTLLASSNVELIYQLASPYLSLIEDTTLISQLDAIEKTLGKDGQTNISQVNNDAPFKIYASALMKISGE